MNSSEMIPFNRLFPRARWSTSDSGNVWRSSSVLTNSWKDASNPKNVHASRIRAPSTAMRCHDGFVMGTVVFTRIFLLSDQKQRQAVAIATGQRQLFTAFHDHHVLAGKPGSQFLNAFPVDDGRAVDSDE